MSKKPPKICFLKRPVPTGKVVKHKRKGGARREGLSAVERHALARELDKVFALEDCVFKNSGEWFAFLLNKREFISSVVQRNKAFVANNVEVAAFATYTTDYGLPPQFVETFCIIFLKKIYWCTYYNKDKRINYHFNFQVFRDPQYFHIFAPLQIQS